MVWQARAVMYCTALRTYDSHYPLTLADRICVDETENPPNRRSLRKSPLRQSSNRFGQAPFVIDAGNRDLMIQKS